MKDRKIIAQIEDYERIAEDFERMGYKLTANACTSIVKKLINNLRKSRNGSEQNNKEYYYKRIEECKQIINEIKQNKNLSNETKYALIEIEEEKINYYQNKLEILSEKDKKELEQN